MYNLGLILYLALQLPCAVCAFGPGCSSSISNRRCDHSSYIRMIDSNQDGSQERLLTSVETRRAARSKSLQKAKIKSRDTRLIEDFMGKRLGQGDTFYGQRLSDLTDENYAKMASETKTDEREEVTPLRPNPVLVLGATGQTGQWVVTELLSKGFNIRILTRNLQKAEDLFGWDGSNLDIFEGDVRNVEPLVEACRGAIAVLFCAGSREPWGSNSFTQVDALGVENAIRAAEISGGEGRAPSVRKFVLLSSIGVSRPESFGLVGRFLGDPLKAKARGEEAVRRSIIESRVVVRAAGLRDGDGLKREVVLGQGDTFGRAGISRLDLATVLTQVLMQQCNNVTFEVRNGEQLEDQRELQEILEVDDQRRILGYFLQQDAKDDEYWAQRFSSLRTDEVYS